MENVNESLMVLEKVWIALISMCYMARVKVCVFISVGNITLKKKKKGISYSYSLLVPKSN